MKIATDNVNGVNARLPVLLRWLADSQPNVACLQELKARQEKFPALAIRAAGYHAIWHGQKGGNGVAVLARGGEPEEAARGLPGDPEDLHSRYLEARVAVPSQAGEATGLAADQDLGAIIAVEIGQHGLADPAAQGDRPEDAGPSGPLGLGLQVPIGRAQDELLPAAGVAVIEKHERGTEVALERPADAEVESAQAALEAHEPDGPALRRRRGLPARGGRNDETRTWFAGAA